MEEQLNEKKIVRLRDAEGNLTFEPFISNGKKYRMIRPGTPIGIKKFSEYRKLSVVVGTGATFANIMKENKEIIDLLSSDKPLAQVRRECILRLDTMQKGILDMSKARFEKAFYLASLFIYPDGGDPMFWDMDYAESMIEDWSVDVDENDLLFFSLSLIPAFNLILNDLKERAEQEGESAWLDFMQLTDQT